MKKQKYTIKKYPDSIRLQNNGYSVDCCSKERILREKKAFTVKEIRRAMERLPLSDCGSNSCQFGGRGRGGQRTNSACRCVESFIDNNKSLIKVEDVLNIINGARTVTNTKMLEGAENITVINEHHYIEKQYLIDLIEKLEEGR